MSKLTEDWPILPLGDLVAYDRPICYGVLKPGEFIPDGIPLIRIVDLVNDQIASEKLYRISSGLDAEFQRSRVLGGEVLVSIQGTIGRVAVVPRELSGANISRTIARIAVNRSVTAGFLSQWLRSPQGQRSLAGSVLGTTRDSLNIGILRRISLTVPLLSEQRMITEILDTADEAIRSTERLIAKLEKAKQGLLHDLLASAIAESGKAWPLDDVSIIAGGLTLGRSISGSESIELPYLRVANVQDGFIDTSEMKRARILRTELERYRLRAGDVLMTEGGDFDKLGRGAVWDGSIDPCLHQNHIFRVRCDPSVLLPQFLAMYSASPAGRRHFVQISKQTTNLASINMTQLKAFPLPIPSLQEQTRIITAAEVQENEIRGELEVLRKLRLLKLGSMDDLLTGRVRVGASA